MRNISNEKISVSRNGTHERDKTPCVKFTVVLRILEYTCASQI